MINAHPADYYDMRTYIDEDYRLLNCFECFNSCGKICKNKNDHAFAPITSSYNPGHGICCPPNSKTEFCTSTDDYICSDPSFLTDD
jgi:hypothetical protein